MKKVLLIINPQSGKNQIKSKLFEIAELFTRAGFSLELYVTQGEKDAKRIVEERGWEKEVVVCSGGDGTLNEVVNGLMGLKKRPLVGYLPSGSANDFAATHGIPLDPLQAATVVIQNKATFIDVGMFNGRYFTYVAAFGLLTEVPYVTPREKKAVLGYQAYLLEGAKRLGRVEKRHLRMMVDEVSYEGDVLIGMVTNSNRIAGIKGLNGRNAQLDDGKFEVMLVEYFGNPLKLTETVTGLLVPEFSTKMVRRFEGSHITFAFDEPTDWVLDGEFGGTQTNVVLEVVKQGLEIVK